MHISCFAFYIRGMDCVVKQSRIQQSKKRIRDLPHLPNFSATKKFFVQNFQFPFRFYKGVAKFISPPQWKFKLGCKKYFPPAKKAFRKPCRERGGEVLEKIQSLYLFSAGVQILTFKNDIRDVGSATDFLTFQLSD